MLDHQLSLPLDAPRRVLDAAERLARELRASLPPGEPWAPESWVERGFDPRSTHRGRFDATVRAAADSAGLRLDVVEPDYGAPDNFVLDPVSYDPLWREAWQHFTAPRDEDGAIRCEYVSREVSRIDARVRGVAIFGVAVMGCGGIIRDYDTLEDFEQLLESRTRVDPQEMARSLAMFGHAEPLIYLRNVYTARHRSGFAVRADEIEVLRVQPAERTVWNGRKRA